MRADGRLTLLPGLRAEPHPEGRVGLTRKFLAGVEEYLRHWNGPVRVLMEPSETAGHSLDRVSVRPSRLPFDLRLVSFLDDALLPLLRDADVVVPFTTHRQNHISFLCRRMGVPSVYVTEYTLRTRFQIARAETPRRTRLWRRCAWEMTQEHQQRRAIRRASGLQCNGTPTFRAYASLNRRPMLYFDTRTRGDMIVPPHVLHHRLAHLHSDRPLRLAFSGRLDPMKGVQHLPHIAHALRQRGTPFQLSIAGGGHLEPALRDEIERLGLQDHVRMLGVLDFHEELLPWMQREVDLFVCPHVQGDPSCTYLETLACGVPIVGFANEALNGLARMHRVAWTSPLGDVERLAQTIHRLSRHPHAIEAAARTARQVALDHTFEATFARRIDHLRRCMEEAPSAAIHPGT